MLFTCSQMKILVVDAGEVCGQIHSERLEHPSMAGPLEAGKMETREPGCNTKSLTLTRIVKKIMTGCSPTADSLLEPCTDLKKQNKCESVSFTNIVSLQISS